MNSLDDAVDGLPKYGDKLGLVVRALPLTRRFVFAHELDTLLSAVMERAPASSLCALYPRPSARGRTVFAPVAHRKYALSRLVRWGLTPSLTTTTLKP